MTTAFHLSLPVPDVEASVAFFTGVLGGTVMHRNAAGYVNVDLFGTQLTLARGDPSVAGISGFHFGWNLDAARFDAIAERLQASAPAAVVAPPRTVDAGTSLERRKMYVRCPGGYLIELKNNRT